METITSVDQLSDDQVRKAGQIKVYHMEETDDQALKAVQMEAADVSPAALATAIGSVVGKECGEDAVSVDLGPDQNAFVQAFRDRFAALTADQEK